MKSVRAILVVWLLSAWLPSAYGQVMALNSTACLPNPNSTIENSLYSRFFLRVVPLDEHPSEMAGIRDKGPQNRTQGTGGGDVVRKGVSGDLRESPIRVGGGPRPIFSLRREQ